MIICKKGKEGNNNLKVKYNTVKRKTYFRTTKLLGILCVLIMIASSITPMLKGINLSKTSKVNDTEIKQVHPDVGIQLVIDKGKPLYSKDDNFGKNKIMSEDFSELIGDIYTYNYGNGGYYMSISSLTATELQVVPPGETITFQITYELNAPGAWDWTQGSATVYKNSVSLGSQSKETNDVVSGTFSWAVYCVPGDVISWYQYAHLTDWYLVGSIDKEISWTDSVTIIAAPTPPNLPTGPSPSDVATGVDRNPTLSVLVSDPNNDHMTVKFYDGSGSLIGTATNVASGTRASVTWSGRSYSTTYYWYVIATDPGGLTHRGPETGTWSFTTMPEPDPKLSYSPSSLDFGTIAQGGTGSKSFNIWNSGGKILHWTVTSNNNWIGRSPSGGSSTGELDKDTITVTLQNSNSLSKGGHDGSLTINSDGINGGSGTVTVHVNIITAPSVTTNDYNPDDLYATKATVSGIVTEDGGQACQVIFQYRTPGGNWNNFGSWSGSNYNTGSTFSTILTSLSGGLTYEYQAGVKNIHSTVWGNTKTFTLPTHVILVIPTVYSDEPQRFTAADINTIHSRCNSVATYFSAQSFGKTILRFEYYKNGNSNNYTMPNTWASDIYHDANNNANDGYTPNVSYMVNLTTHIQTNPNYDINDYNVLLGIQIYPGPLIFRAATTTGYLPNIEACNLSTIWEVLAHESNHGVYNFDDFYYDPPRVTRGQTELWDMMGAYTLAAENGWGIPTAPLICFHKINQGWLQADRRPATNNFQERINDYMNLNLNDNIYVIEHRDTHPTHANDSDYYLEARQGFGNNNNRGVNIYKDIYHPPTLGMDNPFIMIERNNGMLFHNFMSEPTLTTNRNWWRDEITLLNFTYLGDNNGGNFDPIVKVNYDTHSPPGNMIGVILTEGGGDINPQVNNIKYNFVDYYPDFDLHAYTVDGLHVGMNYTTGEYECQIPGALYSGNCSYQEYILVPDGTMVNFEVACRGNKNGNYNYTTQIIKRGEHPHAIIMPNGNVTYENQTISPMVLRNLSTGENTNDIDGDGIPFYLDPNPNEGPTFSLCLNITFNPKVYVLPLSGGTFDLIINVTAGQIPVHNADLDLSCGDSKVTISSVQELGNGQYKVTVSVNGWLGYSYSKIITAHASKDQFVNVSSYMWIRTDIPPEANFSFTPKEPTDIEYVYFTDLSTDKDGYITNWLWDFGDGKTSTEQNPTHQYADNGNYTVKLTVWDDYGAPGSITKLIEVFNVPPVADADGPYYGRPNEPVLLNGSGSSDIDGTIVSYDWDLDYDGQYDDITGMNPSPSWSESGLHHISLRVTDNDGATNTEDTTVYINAPPKFGELSPLDGATNQPVEYLRWHIRIYDIEGDRFNWSIKCSNGQTKSNTDDTNGTKEIVLGNLEYNTEYTVWVNATDPYGSGRTTNGVFTFITHDGPPSIVYVDDSYTYSTPNFGIDHFISIQHGVNHVAIDGTINVYDGNYGEASGIISINKEGILVQGVGSLNPGAIITSNVLIYTNGVTFINLILQPSQNTPALIVKNGVNAATIQIHHNKFNRNSVSNPIGIENQGSGILDVRYNWWGAPNGPSGGVADAITGQLANGDGVKINSNGPVRFDPWAGILAKGSVRIISNKLLYFDGSSSFAYHLDGTPNTISEYYWTFGDGTSSTLKTGSHSYKNPGTYKVTLRIRASDSQLWGSIMYDYAYFNVVIK